MNLLVNWLKTNQDLIISIFFIIVAAWLFKRFAEVFVRKIVVRTVKKNHMHESEHAQEQREETLVQIVSGALNIAIWPMTLIIIISQIGIDVAPLIAGAGIVGVALGFGAQSLVKDIIAGLFIIMENQYRVGDVVDLDGTSGQVERISLRVTVLRDLDGIVHHVPNGTIDRSSNYSLNFSGINLNVGIGYDSDIDAAIGIINRVGLQLTEEDEWAMQIIEAPSFMRVDNLGESSVELKVTGKVLPLQQWAITGELRKRIKAEFDKAGIEIPFPQRVIHQADKPKKKALNKR